MTMSLPAAGEWLPPSLERVVSLGFVQNGAAILRVSIVRPSDGSGAPRAIIELHVGGQKSRFIHVARRALPSLIDLLDEAGRTLGVE